MHEWENGSSSVPVRMTHKTNNDAWLLPDLPPLGFKGNCFQVLSTEYGNILENVTSSAAWAFLVHMCQTEVKPWSHHHCALMKQVVLEGGWCVDYLVSGWITIVCEMAINCSETGNMQERSSHNSSPSYLATTSINYQGSFWQIKLKLSASRSLFALHNFREHVGLSIIPPSPYSGSNVCSLQVVGSSFFWVEKSVSRIWGKS